MTATAKSRVHSSSTGYGAVDSPPSSPLLPTRPRRDSTEYLFKFLVLTQVFMYLEAGAVPSLLQQFTLTFRLSPQEQGLLGAIVYISISLASPGAARSSAASTRANCSASRLWSTTSRCWASLARRLRPGTPSRC